MLKSVASRIASSSTEFPVGNVTAESLNPSTDTTPDQPDKSTARPRKKLSFKEPEIFGYLRSKRCSFRSSRTKAGPAKSPGPSSLRVNLCEEETEDLDELESQAMRVVRTVGQAFEVCHKLSLNAALEDQEVEKERARVRGADDHLHRSDDYDDQDEVTNERQIRRPRSPSPNVHKDISLLGDVEEVREQTPTPAPCILRTHGSSVSPIRQSPSGNAASECGDHLLLGGGETTALRHEIQLLRERLEQQGQQTRAAVAHARLLQDQLAAEAAARVEAQTRTHQLIIQNKELLEHIGALVSHLRDQEHGCSVSHTGATTGQSQVSGGTNLSGMTPQTSTIPDLSSLGQSQGITPGQSSPWELEATPSASSFPYCAYPSETLYQGILSGVGGLESTTDQLHFQTQLLERLHNLSPYQQQQRSPYGTPTTPCYALGAPSFLLSPSSNKPPSSLNVPSSPGGLSLRVSPQANSYASSPVMSHKTSSSHGTSLAESPESLVETVAASFIKPLPCSSPGSKSSLLHVPSVRTNVASFEAGNKPTVDHQQLQQQYQQPRRITLEAPPAGKRKEAKLENMHRSSSSPPRDPGCNETRERGPPSIKSSLASALRSSGPPPSRTTSARLPPRNDLMCQVQRTTWARHTTK